MSVLGLDGVVAAAEKPSERNHFAEGRETAHMIRVKMADHDVIDFFQSRELRGRVDALGVSIAILEPGVDQHGFAGGQGRSAYFAAAMSVNPVNIQIAGLLAAEHAGRRQKQE